MSTKTYKYTLQYTIGSVPYYKVVSPVVEGFTLDRDSEEYIIKKSSGAKFTFVNNISSGVLDFDTIRQIEANDPLQTITIICEKYIDGAYDIVCTLTFSVVDCEMDLDRCTAQVQPQINDAYKCLDQNADIEYNVLDEVVVAPAYIIINPVDLDLFACVKDYYIPITTDANGCKQPLIYSFSGQLNFNDAGLTGASRGIPYDLGTIGGFPTDTYDTHPYYDQSTILAGSCFNTPAFPYGGGWQPISAIYEKYRVITTKVTLKTPHPTTPAVFLATVETVWGAETVITLNDPITNNYNSPGVSYIPFLDIFQGGQQAVVWGREPFYLNQTYVYAHATDNCVEHSYELINPYLDGTGAYRADIYRGRLLNDTLQMFLDKADCGLTLKSDFLQQGTNPVTGERNAFYILNQCTDIKDPDSTEAAEQMRFSFNTLIDNIKALFNVRTYIDGSYYVIEHLQYFENGFSYLSNTLQNIDLRTRISKQTGKKEIIHQNRYTYDRDNIYTFEVISPAQYLDYEFSRLQIEYDADVIKPDGQRGNTIAFDFITDVSGVFSEPATFSNDSVVIVAYRSEILNPITGVSWPVVINEEGYRTGKQITNGWLSVSNLFNRFYRNGRVKLTGTIENNIPETFKTQTKKILQEVSVHDCYRDLFEGNVLVTTELGTGDIVSASHNVVTGVTDLKIKI